MKCAKSRNKRADRKRKKESTVLIEHWKKSVSTCARSSSLSFATTKSFRSQAESRVAPSGFSRHPKRVPKFLDAPSRPLFAVKREARHDRISKHISMSTRRDTLHHHASTPLEDAFSRTTTDYRVYSNRHIIERINS